MQSLLYQQLGMTFVVLTVFGPRTARSVCVHAGEEDVPVFLSAGDQFETDA
jgi:hypothetical protein